jgi:hypothetical protein
VGFPRRNGARPSLRRALIGLAAAALAIPAALLPAVPAAAILPISVVSHSSWTETLPGSVTAIHIVGQVQNNTAGNVALVRISVNLADSKPGDMAWTYATLDVLGPGEKSPFELTLYPAPAGYTGYTMGVTTYAPAASQPYHIQLASTIGSCSAADWVCGTVTNNGAVKVDSVRAVVTYLDGSNTTVATEHPLAENATGGTSLAKNEVGHFQFQLTPGEPPGTHSVVVAEPAYAADLNPNPLDLGAVNVGKTGRQDVTLQNKGPLPITVSSVQGSPTAEFAAATDCPNTGLLGGQSCHVTVRFTPAAKGARSGTLTITDDVAGSPQTVVLTGTGAAPQVAFVPATVLDFGSIVHAGTPGMLKTATLTNVGDGPLTITSMTSDDPADFKVDGSACPVSPYTVAPGGQCTIGVTFVPGIGGPVGMNVPHTNLAAANLVVVDDAGTQKLPLSGLAAGPGAQFSVGSVVIAGVDFGQQAVNAPSLPAGVTLWNNGTEPLIISKIVLTGDFSETDNCGTLPATIAAGASCTLNVRFTPSQAGNAAGRMTVTDNAGTGQQSVALSGVGVNVSGRRQGTGVHRELLLGPIVAIPIQP